MLKRKNWADIFKKVMIGIASERGAAENVLPGEMETPLGAMCFIALTGTSETLGEAACQA